VAVATYVEAAAKRANPLMGDAELEAMEGRWAAAAATEPAAAAAPAPAPTQQPSPEPSRDPVSSSLPLSALQPGPGSLSQRAKAMAGRRGVDGGDHLQRAASTTAMATVAAGSAQPAEAATTEAAAPAHLSKIEQVKWRREQALLKAKQSLADKGKAELG
jgi:hypothetical protein